ncbi:unnamed protein product [Periconia digitata]|uniref:Uncharacterized protein n=1 Tax=Periconia digitata TaxID=1303443 RepID=A0A9W4XXB7_9PLEO|nr:unnamed protein product [Periconia digitata]
MVYSWCAYCHTTVIPRLINTGLPTHTRSFICFTSDSKHTENSITNPTQSDNMDSTHLCPYCLAYKNHLYEHSGATHNGNSESIFVRMKHLWTHIEHEPKITGAQCQKDDRSRKLYNTAHSKAGVTRQRYETATHNLILYQSDEIHNLKTKVIEHEQSLDSLRWNLASAIKRISELENKTFGA